MNTPVEFQYLARFAALMVNREKEPIDNCGWRPGSVSVYHDLAEFTALLSIFWRRSRMVYSDLVGVQEWRNSQGSYNCVIRGSIR